MGLIDNMLLGRKEQEDKSELVAVIIIKADIYLEMYGKLLGEYQRVYKLIEACTTKEALDVVYW